MSRSSVVLPAPEPPMMTTVSLRFAMRSMPFSTCCSLKVFFTSRSTTTSSGPTAGLGAPLAFTAGARESGGGGWRASR